MPKSVKTIIDKMSDTIYRQDAIDAVARMLDTGDEDADRYTAERLLEQLPPAQPEQRWIPCSERLPEEYKRVLVSDVFGVYVGEFVDAEENWGGEHFINEHGMHSKSVKAWMPLPEPYQEG